MYKGRSVSQVDYSSPYMALRQAEAPPAYPNADTSVNSTNEADAAVGFRDSFSDKNVRRAFIRKVYLILAAQMAVTTATIAVFVFVDAVKEFVQKNLYIYLASYIAFLVVVIVLICIPAVRRKHPYNLIGLAAVTLTFSYVAGTISSFYDTQSVLIAAGLTVGITFGVTLFTMQSKIDMTFFMMLAFGLLWTMILWSFVVFFCWWGLGAANFRFLTYLWGGLGALVFTLFLIVDTHLVLGNNKYSMSEEEYVFGALQLYLDIIYIFLYLLMLVGGRK